jgi:hypothetical protein
MAKDRKLRPKALGGLIDEPKIAQIDRTAWLGW